MKELKSDPDEVRRGGSEGGGRRKRRKIYPVAVVGVGA
jgi:hypothetical protein